MMTSPFYDSSNNQDEILQYEEITKRASKTTRAPPKPTLEHCGLISRQQELLELGPPDTRSGCFGCWQLNGQDFAGIPIEELVSLKRAISKAMGHTQPIELVLWIEERYGEIRESVNARLPPGKHPLPEWKAASIMHHLRFHNTDPELQNGWRKYELLELMQISLHASVQRNPDTGEVSIDEKQGKMYLEFMKAYDTQSKTDLSKMNGFSGGAYADSKNAAQGPVVTSGRNVLEYWKSKK